METASLDPLGDRLKAIERVEAGRCTNPELPVIARLDGRAFSTFTRGLKRPYDPQLSDLMIASTKHLVHKFHALIGYTQSDEITLAWEPTEDFMFGGRYQKLTSLLAASVTGFFQKNLDVVLPAKSGWIPIFDCRVWQPASMEELYLNFLWRQDDAMKNSVNSAASLYCSHKQLMGVSRSERLVLLEKQGINWEDYPPAFKWGTFVKAKNVLVDASAFDGADIPEKYRPTEPVIRTVVEELEVGPLRRLENPAALLFAKKDETLPVNRISSAAEVSSEGSV